jgi:hypothetical protein
LIPAADLLFFAPRSEALWHANGGPREDLLGPSNWVTAVAPLAAFTLSLATLVLARLLSHHLSHCYTLLLFDNDSDTDSDTANNSMGTEMDTPMDVDHSGSHSDSGLPFPGEVVDGEQTIQYFDIK